MLKNSKFLISAAFVASIFSACGLETTENIQSSADLQQKEDSVSDASVVELINGEEATCNKRNEDIVAQIADKTYRLCEDGEWVKISKSEALEEDFILGQDDENEDSSSSKNAKSSSSKQSSVFDDEDEVSSDADVKSSASTPSAYIVETEDEIPECTAKREGSTVEVESTGKKYICDDGDWISVRSSAKSSSSTTSLIKSSSSVNIGTIDANDYGLGSCTLDRHGEVAKFTLDGQYYICKVGTWQSASLLEIDTYGHPCNASNVGEAINGNVDELNKYSCTSSGWLNINVGYIYHRANGNLWDGGSYRVITGLDDGNNHSGYWFSHDDNGGQKNGNSQLKWITATGNEYDANALNPIIDLCGGVCGTYTLGNGYKYPYVGVGINLTGPDHIGADITSWGGICLVYRTTGTAPTLEIPPQDEDTYTEYNNYQVKLAVAETPTRVNLSWDMFKQEVGWGKTVAQAAYLTRVAQIKFIVSGTAGKTGAFGVYALGTLDECNL